MVGPVENGKKNMKLPNAMKTSITSKFVHNFFFPELKYNFYEGKQMKMFIRVSFGSIQTLSVET
jgi:hypothetical protein